MSPLRAATRSTQNCGAIFQQEDFSIYWEFFSRFKSRKRQRHVRQLNTVGVNLTLLEVDNENELRI
jgi:hypothetical protein